MRQTNFALALLAAATLAACGGHGSSGGDQSLKVKYTQQVSFGDSLADVGSYNVGAVKQLGGGKFTINGDATSTNPALTGKIWLELMAAQFGLPAPCAAQTGLAGDATKGFAVPVVSSPGCFSYAMGGSRVTNPIGPNNAATGSAIGALTVPVVTQVANHLAKSGGKFSGTEIVYVMSGGNDALALLGGLSTAATAAGLAEGAKVGAQTFITTLAGLLGAGATAPATATQAIGAAMGAEALRSGSTRESIVGVGVATAALQPGNSAVASDTVYGPMVDHAKASAATAGTTAATAAGAAYAAANGPKLIPQMAAAGTELAALVKTQIVGKGANYVVVNNLPDLGNAPASKAKDASTQQLILAMVDAFNAALKAGVDNDAKIMYVDLWAISHDQIMNPAPYGLTNTSTPACATNALGTTSLACTASTLIAGDVSHYMFADDVHPTPFEHSLIARYVAEQMIVRGWL